MKAGDGAAKNNSRNGMLMRLSECGSLRSINWAIEMEWINQFIGLWMEWKSEGRRWRRGGPTQLTQPTPKRKQKSLFFFGLLGSLVDGLIKINIITVS